MGKESLFSVTKKDLIIQTFKSTGPGGQNKNKTETAVRIIHKESGVRAEATEERSQIQNKQMAFKRLINKPEFKVWLNRKILEAQGQKSLEDKIEEMMDNKHIKIEVRNEQGQWTEYKEEAE